MGLTLQVMTKTYCCNNEDKDKTIFNEDLKSNLTEDSDDKEKLVATRINSFETDINKSINLLN